MLNVPIVATAVLAAAGIGLAAGFLGAGADAHARYAVSIERAERASETALKLCTALAARDWERCTAKVLTDHWRATADADAAYRNSAESYRVQRFVAAGTAFILQTLQCGALAEPARSACDKSALAAYRQATARVSTPEITEKGCDLTGCPAPARPATQAAKLREV